MIKKINRREFVQQSSLAVGAMGAAWAWAGAAALQYLPLEPQALQSLLQYKSGLDAVLAGQPVPEPQVPSIGCNIKWLEGAEPDYFNPAGMDG